MLIGSTGVGKSSLANTLYGDKTKSIFKEGATAAGCTKRVQEAKVTSEEGGEK